MALTSTTTLFVLIPEDIMINYCLNQPFVLWDSLTQFDTAHISKSIMIVSFVSFFSIMKVEGKKNRLVKSSTNNRLSTPSFYVTLFSSKALAAQVMKLFIK